MSFLDDIINAGRGALESGSQWLDENTALGTHRRNADRLGEIIDFAASQGFPLGSADPGFRRQFPDLADEADALNDAFVMAQGGGQVALPAGAGALVAARGMRPSSGGPGGPSYTTVGGGPTPPASGPALPPGSAPPVSGSGRPTYTTVGGGPVPSSHGPNLPSGSVPPPQAPPGGWVPSQSANPPGVASPQGPQGPTPGRVNGGIPMPGAAPAGPAATPGGPRSGLLTTIRNLPRGAKIAAGVLGTGIVGTGIAAGTGLLPVDASPPAGQAADGYGPGTPRTEGAWKEHDKAEERRRADALRDQNNRASEANISLTEAQAAYYQAQREKALKELANSDLSDSEKLELAHEYALEEVRTRAEAERGNIMIREAGENERTGIREAGEDRRTIYRGDVEMRGQDQLARAAQDAFVNNWITNQIANGQLSLERATKMMEAYQKQQKLPSEILQSVSTAFSQMAPYRTNRKPGQVAPGFEAGGLAEQIGKKVGLKVDTSGFQGAQENDWLATARSMGAVPNTSPMPTPDQVFQGAGQGADMSSESVRSIRDASASSTMLPRPGAEPMPDDFQQRLLMGLR